MSDWLSGDVIANGIRIHYYRSGGDKQPILLAHGITDNGLCWPRAADDLRADFDVITYDARGHGLSGRLQTVHAFEDHADDAAGLIEALGLRNPGMAGHSMGGATTAITAARYPNLLRFAILEDPALFREPLLSSAEGTAARTESLVELQAKTKEQLIAHCRERSPAWDEAVLAPWAEAKLQVDPRIWDLLRGTDVTWQEIVQAITCPTLLVTAEPDKGSIIAPDFAREIVDTLVNGRLARIEGAGHNIRREQFGAYMEAVRTFLAAIL